MTSRFEFIDNRNGNTLANALRTWIGSFDQQISPKTSVTPISVRVATAFFNPTGFAEISDQLCSVPEVRVLLGADPATVYFDRKKKIGETQSQFDQHQMMIGLERMDNSLRKERDELPFVPASSKALNQLVGALRAGNIDVRRYEKAFLHAKSYIVAPDPIDSSGQDGVIVGSSNLTRAGLSRNLELNLGRFDSDISEMARNWFDDLWEDATPFDLAEVYEDALMPRTPWDIFVRVLWHLYGNEVEEDSQIDGNLPLTSFQKHGVTRAIRLIQQLGGAIVADEVGLGKTYIAGEILQRFSERRQRALLVCPASLRDTTWRWFLSEYQMFTECLSFEQLANDSQLRDALRPNADQSHLQRPVEEYQLVIVDEAHNYRNPDTPTRAGALRRLMYGKRRDLLLLTATPVNNSLWDLYHLIRFFVRQDAQLAERGILSIRERFDRAMREDPSNLSPDILYPVIDATTVKRTRQFVKRHYIGDTIKGIDGTPQPIVFPKPTAITVRYNLDDLLPGFFDELERSLDPDDENAITFARYMPDHFLLKADDRDFGRSPVLAGLLRSGLLKRFESSAFAFSNTVRKMVHEHGVFLNALDKGYVVETPFMKEISGDDDAVFDDVLSATEHRRDAELYDIRNLRNAVERDLNLLQSLLTQSSKIEATDDPKLKVLVDALESIVAQAQREAIDHNDEVQKRKVLVFSFFEDTVEWVNDHLESILPDHPVLAGYCNRIVAVSGSGDLSPRVSGESCSNFRSTINGFTVW